MVLLERGQPVEVRRPRHWRADGAAAAEPGEQTSATERAEQVDRACPQAGIIQPWRWCCLIPVPDADCGMGSTEAMRKAYFCC